MQYCGTIFWINNIALKIYETTAMIDIDICDDSLAVETKMDVTPAQEVIWDNYDNQDFYQIIATDGLK